MTSRSRIEQAKALRALKGVTTSDAEFAALARTLFPTPDPERDRALEGLSQEDEFAILCRLMGTCTHLARLDQTPLLEGNERRAPDFLASFAPGCSVLGLSRTGVGRSYSCFVEVKSVDKGRFKLSERDLTRREEFAHHFILPLVFAVRFKQLQGAAWLLVTSRQLRTLNRGIDMLGLGSGVGHALMDDYMLVAPNAFDAVYTWDATVAKASVLDPRHGALVALELFDKGTRVGVPDNERLFVAAVIETFRPTIASATTTGSRTTQILRVSANQGRLLTSMIYECNQLSRDQTTGKTAYDAVRITSSFDAATPHMTLFTRDHVEYIVQRHFINRRLYKVSIGVPDDQLTLLKSLTSRPLKI
jgi:hypothetical protein